MLQDAGLILAGLLALVAAGDALVRGAEALSLRLGIPALIVGLTVVAFGTSAPEMVVAVVAVLSGAPALALGNVVGSNIANILLVLGLPALLVAVRTDVADCRKDYSFMLGTAVLLIVLAFAGPIGWPQAALLLAVLAAMMASQVRAAMTFRAMRARVPPAGEEDIDIEATPAPMSWPRIALFLAAGLAGLPVGAQLLVSGAVDIARVLGVSEAVIGLTLVAVGTSLPELATSVAAALRGRADVALGNVIGSNIFNILAILGVAGLVGSLPMPAQMLRFDLWVMLAVALVLGPFVFRRRQIGHIAGAAFVALYAGYVVVLGLGAGQ